MNMIKNNSPVTCGKCKYFNHHIGRCNKNTSIDYKWYNQRPKNCPLNTKKNDKN